MNFVDEGKEVKQLQSQFEIDAWNTASALKKSMNESVGILKYVLKMILHDTGVTNNNTGAESESEHENEDESPTLNRTLLKDIFSHYGERSLLRDDAFIDEMIQAASGESGEDGNDNPTKLNVDTFLRALTHDIQLYDVRNEYKFQTHYEDVFGLVTTAATRMSMTAKKNYMPQEDKDDINDVDMDKALEVKFDIDDVDVPIDVDKAPQSKTHFFIKQSNDTAMLRVFTFPQIDFAADSFRSRTQYIFVWLAVVTGYLFWFQSGNQSNIQVCREEHRGTFGCDIGQSIVLWLMIMAQML